MDIEKIITDLSEFDYPYDMDGVEKIEINITPTIKTKTFRFIVGTRSESGVPLSPLADFYPDEYFDFIDMLRKENLKVSNIKIPKTKSYIEVSYVSSTGNINFKRSITSEGSCDLSVELDQSTAAHCLNPALYSLEDYLNKLTASLCKK